MAHYSLARALQRSGKTADAEAEFARHAEIMKRILGTNQTGVATAE